MARKSFLLGDFLVEQGIITREQLREALKYHHEKGIRLGRALIELGFVSEDQIIRALSEQLNVQYVKLKTYKVDPEVLRLISPEIAWNYLALPLFRIRERLTVAMVNPLDIFAIDALTRASKMKIEPVVCSESDMREALRKYYPKRKSSPAPTPDTVEPAPAPEEQAAETASEPTNGYWQKIDDFLKRLAEKKARQAFVLGNKIRVDFGEYQEDWPLPDSLDKNSFIRMLCSLGDEVSTYERLPHRFLIDKKYADGPCRYHVLAGSGVKSETAMITLQMARNEEMAGLPETSPLARLLNVLPHTPGLVVLAAPDLYLLDQAFYATWQAVHGKFRYPIAIENQPTAILPDATQLVSCHPAEQLAMLRYVQAANCDGLFLKNITDASVLQQVIQLAETGVPVVLGLVTTKPWMAPELLFGKGYEEFARLVHHVYYRAAVTRLCPECRKKVQPPQPLKKLLNGKSELTIYDDTGCEACQQQNGQSREIVEFLWEAHSIGEPRNGRNGRRNGHAAKEIRRALEKQLLPRLKKGEIGLSQVLPLLAAE